jgi:uncharacterized protein YlbG (UPF0298 family)
MLALEITFEKGKAFDIDILLNEKKISYFHKFYENENCLKLYVSKNEFEKIRSELMKLKYVQKVRSTQNEEILV